MTSFQVRSTFQPALIRFWASYGIRQRNQAKYRARTAIGADGSVKPLRLSEADKQALLDFLEMTKDRTIQTAEHLSDPFIRQVAGWQVAGWQGAGCRLAGCRVTSCRFEVVRGNLQLVTWNLPPRAPPSSSPPEKIPLSAQPCGHRWPGLLQSRRHPGRSLILVAPSAYRNS